MVGRPEEIFETCLIQPSVGQDLRTGRRDVIKQNNDFLESWVPIFTLLLEIEPFVRKEVIKMDDYNNIVYENPG